MNRTPVTSSNLASVGYDPDRHVLEVGFHNGTVYQYFAVPHSVYDGLMRAGSHGRYFDAFVKKAGFQCRRVS